jgi:hypothetical protein
MLFRGRSRPERAAVSVRPDTDHLHRFQGGSGQSEPILSLDVVDSDPGSSAFLTLGSKIRDPWWVKNPDPGWTLTWIIFPRASKQFFGLKYLNSSMWIRDGKKFGYVINIPNPQHCFHSATFFSVDSFMNYLPTYPIHQSIGSVEDRVCIHKDTLHKQIDFKADSFLRLFIDIHLGTFWRLPDSSTSQFFYNTYWRILPLPFGAWGGGGGDIEILKGTKWNDNYAIKVITYKY